MGNTSGGMGNTSGATGPVSTSELAGRLEEDGLVLLDVRRAEEFAGLVTAPCDPRPGRIPGARHVELDLLLVAGDPAAVRSLVGVPPGTEVIAYCHSGNRSATAVHVLAAAGYDARNYVGSWHEWSRDPTLPAEVGPSPGGSPVPS
jgi:thiosulfate/3-mercaptopyruvate sulfurtransferase